METAVPLGYLDIDASESPVQQRADAPVDKLRLYDDNMTIHEHSSDNSAATTSPECVLGMSGVFR